VLSRKAIHGGQATHEKLDADTIAAWPRGGMLPQADGYPAERRATRELLRRRMSRMRTRAARRPPVQQTTPQYHLPALGKRIADTAHREGVAERWPAPAGQNRSEGDLALSDASDCLLTTLELALAQTATAHEAQTFYRVRASSGVGKLLALVRLDELQAIHRCPRVQAFVPYGRLVKWAKEAAGTRDGTAGTQLGNAYLKGACAEAAVLCWRNHPAGHKDLARSEKQQGTGKALPVLAPTLARAVYDRAQRHTAVDLDKFFQACGSGAGAPAALRAAAGSSLAGACWEP
jgi:hypothetical protein